MARSVVAVLALLFLAVLPLRAQILDGARPSGGTSIPPAAGGTYYNFSSGSGCELQVSIWGFVGGPGRYSIPCQTDLLALLSYCGGPKDGAYLDRVKIVRRGNVGEQNEVKQVLEVNIEKYLHPKGKPAMLDELNLWPGDLIIIDGETTNTVDTFLRVAQVIVAVSSLVTTTVAVINLTKK